MATKHPGKKVSQMASQRNLSEKTLITASTVEPHGGGRLLRSSIRGGTPGRSQKQVVPQTVTVPQCNFCHRTFTKKCELRMHMLTHHCSVCGKAFILPNSLKAHMNIHSLQTTFNFGKRYKTALDCKLKKCKMTQTCERASTQPTLKIQAATLTEMTSPKCNVKTSTETTSLKHCMKKHVKRKICHTRLTDAGERQSRGMTRRSKEASTKPNLKMKMASATKEKTLKCNIKTQTTTPPKCNVKTKIATPTETTSLKCNVSPKTLAYAEELQRPSMEHKSKRACTPTEMTTLKCNFKTEFAEPTETSPKCNVKKQTLTDAGELKRPMMTGGETFQCGECDQMFLHAGDLMRHMLIHTTVTTFHCSLCNKRFSQAIDLEKHIVDHTEKSIFLCSVCGKLFFEYSKVKKHMVTYHKLTHPVENRFQGTKCDKIFSQTRYLKDPTFIHKLYCSKCDKVFAFAHSLKAHMLLAHSGEGCFPCGECPQKFYQAKDLNKHMRLHSDQRSFPCSVCTKRFYAADHLRTHMVIHTGEREFQCDVCDKTFTQASNLTAHMVVHTGEKRFQCSVCHKKFLRAKTRNVHMLVHTRERRFKCCLCNGTFSHSHTLKRHMVVEHAGET